MKKQALLTFIAHFEKELEGLLQSAKSAHLAATHEESRAEDRHDTFAIESSYLAAGQAERVKDLRRTLQELNQFLASNTAAPTEVKLGVLLCLRSEQKTTYSVVLQTGGGTQIQVDGKMIGILSPLSPLGEQAMGLARGDEFTVEAKNGSREHTVVDIW